MPRQTQCLILRGETPSFLILKGDKAWHGQTDLSVPPVTMKFLIIGKR